MKIYFESDDDSGETDVIADSSTKVQRFCNFLDWFIIEVAGVGPVVDFLSSLVGFGVWDNH